MRIFVFVITLIGAGSVLFAQQTANQTKVVTGTVLINDRTPLDFKTIPGALKTDWGVRVDSFNLAEKTLVLYTPVATVMLANMDYPAPAAEIRGAAELTWMWETAADEALRHQSQVIISVIGAAGKPVDLYKLFTRVAAAVLDNTRSCGVYMNTQFVLQSRAFYLQAARNLTEKALPIYCWVFFGMAQQEGQSSAYTYGMQEFGMPDLEIFKSSHSLQEAHAVLYDIVANALQNNIRLQDGSVVETLEGQKITLKLTKSALLEGQTLLRVEY
ncbi:MAG: DUF4261 domain-containing protein [Thermoanaerobaculia bacterium]|nr:DUF4261 domain-containing protein [Thermoanaerobaculia bacterium]